ncbi:MAG TPA: hypothetical protein PK858_02685, partial [Saprospiraceae bacterium]|nr:hypothetical protein [Saprospiraceae bacterium]
MKSLSYWAKAHVRTARLLIVLLHILAMLLAYEVGVALYAWQSRPCAEVWPWLTLAFMLCLRWMFPRRSAAPSATRRYWRSRLVLLGMVCASWGLVGLAGHSAAHWASQPELISQNTASPRLALAYGQAPLLMAEGQRPEQMKAGYKWLIAKKKAFIKAKVHRALGKKPLNEGDKIALTLLALAIFALLGSLVAALACNLSCAGQDAAALVVILLGGLGLGLGLVAALKAIWPRNSEKGLP